jgi:hypothetical protein
MEGNYKMQHIRQDIITHKSRKMGNNSIKNMPQDINQERLAQDNVRWRAHGKSYKVCLSFIQEDVMTVRSRNHHTTLQGKW